MVLNLDSGVMNKLIRIEKRILALISLKVAFCNTAKKGKFRGGPLWKLLENLLKL